MANKSPYGGLGADSFWRGGLNTHPLAPGNLYRKVFDISPTDRIATAGSCFAQHIARAMRAVNLNVIDAEPLPRGLSAKDAAEFGYGLYSARFANIYTTRQLLQLLQEAFEGRVSPDPVWIKDGRYYDSMRPSVEPEGLLSEEEVIAHRIHHLGRVREMVEQCDVFVFTLGLTECWEFRETGWVFPSAPGTIAGTFDPQNYRFRNFTYPEVISDMIKAISIFRKHSRSSNLRFLFTVSPVPLTATYSDNHVQVATTYSKSVLRAVAGDLVSLVEGAAYFPSFEIVTAPTSRGVFFDVNMRSVNSAGVDIIMNTFLREHGFRKSSSDTKHSAEIWSPEEMGGSKDDGIACEEALLEVFAPR